MTRRDVSSCYCDWRVQSGGRGWWWGCDVKMVERWCWRTREIECTPMVHRNNVCGLCLTVIFLWDVLMIFHALWPLWDFLLRFHVFWPLSQTRLFQNSRGFDVDGEEARQRHAWEIEFGRREGGVMGNICWEGARVVGFAWSLSLPSLLVTVFLIMVLPSSFLALPVNELCLLIWPNPYATSCFVLHTFIYISNGICCFWAVLRFPYEMSCFWVYNFRVRFPCFWVHAFCYIIRLWYFMLFGLRRVMCFLVGGVYMSYAEWPFCLL